MGLLFTFGGNQTLKRESEILLLSKLALDPSIYIYIVESVKISQHGGFSHAAIHFTNENTVL